MRRLLDRFGFAAAVAIVAGFVGFTVFIAQPLRGVERPYLVRGAVRAVGPLRAERPFLRYVALFKGAARSLDALPPYPIDDLLTDDTGRFELSADRSDGTRFTVLARYENTLGELYCRLVPLPPVRERDGEWFRARTDAPLPPLSIAVDKSLPCD